MLADPQTFNVGGNSTNFVKTLAGPTSSVFHNETLGMDLTVKQNASASRFRREIRLSKSKIAADPISGANKLQGVSVYVVIDEPRNGVFTDAEILVLTDAMYNYLGLGNVDNILQGEY